LLSTIVVPRLLSVPPHLKTWYWPTRQKPAFSLYRLSSDRVIIFARPLELPATYKSTNIPQNLVSEMALEKVSKMLLELVNEVTLDLFPKTPTNASAAADSFSFYADDSDPGFSSDSEYSTDSDETSSEYSFFEPPRPCSPPPGYIPWQYASLDDSYDTDASSMSCDSAASVYSALSGPRQDLDTQVGSPTALSEEDERLLAETYALLDPRNKPQDDVVGRKPPCTLGAVSFPVLTATGNVVVVKIDHRELFDDLGDLVDQSKPDTESPSATREIRMVLT
jgi:hypothetical protein